MNRDLKFRYWDKDRYLPCGFIYPENKHHIEQYTGLKDRNGQEIYEGDIVKSEKWQREGFVVYLDEYGGFIIWWTSDNDFSYLGETVKKCHDLEIIGNIHQPL